MKEPSFFTLPQRSLKSVSADVCSEAEFRDARSLARCSTRSARERLPYRQAAELRALPLGVLQQPAGQLFSAAIGADRSSSEQAEVVKAIRFAAGMNVRLIEVDADAIGRAIDLAYHGDDMLLREAAEELKQSLPESPRVLPEEIDLGAENEFLDRLIRYGAAHQASDLHLIPLRAGSILRIRINGTLLTHNAYLCSPESHRVMIRRVKILAKLDPTITTIPQDGSFQRVAGSSTVHLRVSLMPTLHGERLVLRLIGNQSVLGLDQLGLAQESVAELRHALGFDGGVILLCGPTGSGKTTALYASANLLAAKNLNVVSVEDPVEAEVPGIVQTSLHSATGLDYPTALKALLRQDPDAILLGEIRDPESAKIAFDAASTGHLVLSCTHAGNPFECFLRLQALGVPYSLQLATLRLVLSVRLVPTLCQRCKVFDLPASKELGRDCYRPTGCTMCDYSGYRGRTLVEDLFLPEERYDFEGEPNAQQLERIVKSGIRVSRGSRLDSLLAEGLLSPSDLEH